VQVELFNRKKWKTRIEMISTAIHDHIELWHNTRRRHSALGMLTTTEIENRWLESREDPGPLRPRPTPQLTRRSPLTAL
jgi:putative transposase